MSNKKELWYSIHDGGDGSAYPKFFPTKELAEADQDNLVEEQGYGWGEPCFGKVPDPGTVTEESSF